MDVFIAHMPSPDDKPLPAADLFEDSLEFVFNILVSQHFAAVFWGPDHMILADVGAMAELVQPSVGHS